MERAQKCIRSGKRIHDNVNTEKKVGERQIEGRENGNGRKGEQYE